MNTLCVLTPTFNRRHLLPELFASLCAQDDPNFTWMIMDDGSTDGTQTLIPDFQTKAKFEIRYYKKENGGKHTALNAAYPHIDSILTIIVDSDDQLAPNAVSTIKSVYETYRDEKDLCGFSFLRKNWNGGYLSTSDIPKDGMKESFVDCRINRGIGGDMAEVWYTHCLREYPFPEFTGEKFLGEDIVWIQMAQKYQLRFFNQVIYFSDYLEDGLTSNRRKNNIASPNGCVARAEVFLNANVNLKAKIKAGLQFYIYGRFANLSVGKLYQRASHKLLFLFLCVPAHLIYLKWKAEYLQ